MITVIGNGESRKNIDISKIKGVTVGCNAIYLHESVDYICAMDKFWRDKIVKETKIPLISRLHNMAFQTTLELFDGEWQNTKCPYRGYCSGISALDYMASIHRGENIFLIGFDFGYKGDKVNHVYKDTPNHPTADKKAQNEDIFLKQCIETVKRYPKNNFYWVTDSDFLIKIKELKKISIEDYERLAY